jgi:hypothetical protein
MNVLSNAPSHPISHRGQAQGAAACCHPPPGPQQNSRSRTRAVSLLEQAIDTNARDSAIAASLAQQYGADIETIRKALCRNSHGRASGPRGIALDLLTEVEGDS